MMIDALYNYRQGDIHTAELTNIWINKYITVYGAIVCRSMRGLCVLHFHIIFENYDIDAYTNIEGVVTELNPPYRGSKS